MAQQQVMAKQFECEDCHLIFPTIHQLDWHERHACWFTPYYDGQCYNPLECDCKSRADREDILQSMKHLSIQSYTASLPHNIS